MQCWYAFNISCVCVRACVCFEGKQEAPAEPPLGEGGEENNSAGSCQLSAEMKGEEPAGRVVMTAALFSSALEAEVNARLMSKRGQIIHLQFTSITSLAPSLPDAFGLCCCSGRPADAAPEAPVDLDVGGGEGAEGEAPDGEGQRGHGVPWRHHDRPRTHGARGQESVLGVCHRRLRHRLWHILRLDTRHEPLHHGAHQRVER